MSGTFSQKIYEVHMSTLFGKQKEADLDLSKTTIGAAKLKLLSIETKTTSWISNHLPFIVPNLLS